MPACQVSITTMRSSEEKGQLLGREQIQMTFASEDNDVVQLTSTGDVLVQSSEESFAFQQLAPVDEAVYGICHELCAVLSFDRKATTLIEECADGTTKTYDKTSMVEETYWRVCRQPGKPADGIHLMEAPRLPVLRNQTKWPPAHPSLCCHQLTFRSLPPSR
ncbi:unnamed protein product [Effrenium voratum]|nr:unnamed protein product [Effrenium voratum]